MADDILAPQHHRESLKQSGLDPCFIFAANVLDDEARRPHIGPMVRTSLLQHFEENCLFVTANTVYVLSGHGKRTSVTEETLYGRGSSPHMVEPTGGTGIPCALPVL